jgi:exosortase
VAREWALLPLWQVAAMAALLLWLYAPTLTHLILQWWRDPNFSHGFFVPLFSAYLLWQRRARLTSLSLRPSWWGMLGLTLGLGVLVVGQWGADIFLPRLSLLIVPASLIVLFLGWNFFRAILFPWALLLLMIPIPAIVFNKITFPLQLLASRIASTTLSWMGVPVLRAGNVIILAAMRLEVAEACSGIRSLMSLMTLAIIYAYLLERRIWVRVVLALASIPFAVAANSVRIIGTGLLVQYWDPDKAEGYFHASWGLLIFVISLLMLYLLHRIICLIWPDKEEKA